MLKKGKYYWMRPKDAFGDWRPCRIFRHWDGDYIHRIGCTARKLSDMNLNDYKFIEMSPPEDSHDTRNR